MGLFSRIKKETEKETIPSSMSGMPPVKGMPPAPSAMQAGTDMSSPSQANRSPFDDIKQQVSSFSKAPSLSEEVGSESSGTFIREGSSLSNSNSNPINPKSPSFDLDDDSLFDLPELNFNSGKTGSNMGIEEELDVLRPEKSLGKAELGVDKASLDADESLNFISNKNARPKAGPNATYFVTTHQFKVMLEIIESVKSKVKGASETHLRLLDIKSEEDIEYENLRKDFQFIEDKLYELDSIIFDK